MTNEEKVRIMVINKQKYLGRKCTEKEVKDEISALFLKSLIGETGEKGISREYLRKTILEEDLKGYIHIKSELFEKSSGEYEAAINIIDGYYTLMATGERGRLAVNDAFETIEQAYYALLQYVRKVKKEFEGSGYRPYKIKEPGTGEG